MSQRTLLRKPRVLAAAGLLAAGLASGAVLGLTMTAGASTSGSGTGASSTTPPSATSAGTGAPTARPPSSGLPKSGTVTAVGSDSVTIDGTAYAVTASSDIDKNGEATLADLTVGDKVTFSTMSSASTPTIDKLHAGNESLDRPSGAPPGANGGTPPAAGGSAGEAPPASNGTAG